MKNTSGRDHRWVCLWLFVGVVMVFFQIILGGVTRLTGSGLSITKWEIVTGTLPPLNHAEWVEAFDQYKITPQYQLINEGMSMRDFKFIFFWEYIHRLWARSMGFVFLIPFLIFLARGSLQRKTIQRLGVVVGIASLAAIFGWIMVASGLIKRPWVNAYKLTIHLSLGISLFIMMVYTWLQERGIPKIVLSEKLKRFLSVVLILSVIQVILGGLVSGMKAALNYPTWPKMHGNWLPDILLDTTHWNSKTFLFYDHSGFMPALVQFMHRNMAYVLFILVVWFGVLWINHVTKELKGLGYVLLGIIVVQVLLGILTLIGSVGAIPVLYGALHQAVGILFLTLVFYLRWLRA